MLSRTFRPALVLLALSGVSLGACASSGSRLPSRGEELARLTAECEARGGILTPTGQATGREPLDNYCRITGGPSDRLRPQN